MKMTVSEEERAVLDIINKRGLIRKSELVSILSSTGYNGSFAVVHTLIDKGLVATLTPLGEASYAVTKIGMQFLREGP